jgi:MoaA/NifB/PqqE/SkfB family radical SAM enzyme
MTDLRPWAADTPVRKNLPLIFQQKNYCDGTNPGHLDVRITNLCDNACSFCIAAEGMQHARKFNLEAMLESIKQVNPASVSIIGGEPLLFMKKLLDFMDRVKTEVPSVQHFYITTALPRTVMLQRDLFKKVFDATEVLNISLQHYKDEDNSRLMNAKQEWPRMKWLEEFLSIPGATEKVRVHLNLVRGGIDSPEAVAIALGTLREAGVKHVKLNELMNAPDEYVSFEDITGDVLPSPYSYGCSTKLDYLPGLEVTLKRSCWVVEPSRAATKLDLLKVMAKAEGAQNEPLPRVLYEDGELSTHWLTE